MVPSAWPESVVSDDTSYGIADRPNSVGCLYPVGVACYLRSPPVVRTLSPSGETVAVEEPSTGVQSSAS